MAPDDPHRRTRRKHSSKSNTRTKDAAERDDRAESGDQGPEKPQTVDELREARLAYLAQSPEERKEKMKYIGETVVVQKTSTGRNNSGHRRSVTSERNQRKPGDTNRKRSRPTTRVREEDSEDDYVYGRPEPVTEDEELNVPHKISGVPRKSDTPRRSQTRRASTNRVTRDVEERRTPSRRKTEPVRRRNSYGIDERDTPERPSPQESARLPLRKSATSIRELPRPSLQRSLTSTRAKTEVSMAPSTTVSSAKRTPSLFSSLLPAPPRPEKKTSCLTCGADDVPMSRAVKLSCSHRMCHSCLRRIFTMSVSDPAHMPPRCCTAEHIPLKFVDKLFDQKFKKTWNHKFEEYTTRNRIYCPTRGCGEWIKPHHVTIERGRKVGKCKRCSTRVCCTCGNKMHTSRECPNDPATQKFDEIAKQQGWQKCFNCKAIVELKEGCNHMTCRCMAEFCMVCGLKWKSCDCPWFNYEQIDAHLDPVRAQEALDRRRVQEQRDEALARRMEILGVDDEEDPRHFGIGNAAGHHMNANFIQQAREALTANYQVAEQAARDLLNGLVTGRENRLPGPPLPPAETVQLLRQPSRRGDAVEAPARRPTRQHIVRLDNEIPNAAFDQLAQTASERAQDRRIQDWANGVTPV